MPISTESSWILHVRWVSHEIHEENEKHLNPGNLRCPSLLGAIGSREKLPGSGKIPTAPAALKAPIWSCLSPEWDEVCTATSVYLAAMKKHGDS
jgi:hypothetical protein